MTGQQGFDADSNGLTITRGARHFDQLPDSAVVSMDTLCAVLGIGRSSGWRRTKTEPGFPKPIRLGHRCTRFRVGDIRALMNAGIGKPFDGPPKAALEATAARWTAKRAAKAAANTGPDATVSNAEREVAA